MKPRRLISPPGTYFVTFSTWQRRRLFVVESNVRLFLKTLYGYRREGRFELHAFVLMPEHVHLLLTPALDVTARAGNSANQGRILACAWECDWKKGRSMAARIHRSPHSRSTGFHAPSRLHSSEPGSAQDCERSVRVSLLLCLSRIQARHAALSGSSRNLWEHPNRHEWNSCPSRFSRRQKQLTKPKRDLSQTLHLRVRRWSDADEDFIPPMMST